MIGSSWTWRAAATQPEMSWLRELLIFVCDDRKRNVVAAVAVADDYDGDGESKTVPPEWVVACGGIARRQRAGHCSVQKRSYWMSK